GAGVAHPLLAENPPQLGAHVHGSPVPGLVDDDDSVWHTQKPPCAPSIGAFAPSERFRPGENLAAGGIHFRRGCNNHRVPADACVCGMHTSMEVQSRGLSMMMIPFGMADLRVR